jgi:hypothetical protein
MKSNELWEITRNAFGKRVRYSKLFEAHFSTLAYNN